MRRLHGWTSLFVLLSVAALTATLALLTRVLLPSRGAADDTVDWDASSDTLGMVLIDIRDGEAASFYHVDELGVYVLAVGEKTSADAAGVLTGDRLVALNGESVSASAQINDLLASLHQGDTLSLTLKRPGESGYLRLTLPLSADDTATTGGDS